MRRTAFGKVFNERQLHFAATIKKTEAYEAGRSEYKDNRDHDTTRSSAL